ncbi:hypothetical protein [Jeotgalibacillus proteolyticus]|uniref:Uncharacterized protein n=1 Tax=Jeotgalibacillus proteolyticus TaxID=2082395 RepID=A0A2S5G978_9BACL|nr:hypothetical protein [Jeotgalibacillus proteolyticus]PPA69538.1 hypothetical protein C4B60_13395 [Jeotgalibacillus proteolyticus]
MSSSNYKRIKDVLELLCMYDDVEMTHVFRKNNQEVLSVSSNSKNIELIFADSREKEQYSDVEAATFVIERSMSSVVAYQEQKTQHLP